MKATLFLLLLAAPLHAQQGGILVLSFDSFRSANGTDGFKSTLESGAHGVPAAGASLSGAIDAGSSIGGRIALLVPTGANLAVGPSFGYIKGPNADATAVINGGAGTLTGNRDVSWMRLLTEFLMRFPIGRGEASFNLGGGFGIARGSVHEQLSCSGGPLSCASPGTDDRDDWTGVTYEISPGFSYKSIIGGYRWAWFPKYGGTQNISRINWSTSELYIGLAF